MSKILFLLFFAITSILFFSCSASTPVHLAYSGAKKPMDSVAVVYRDPSKEQGKCNHGLRLKKIDNNCKEVIQGNPCIGYGSDWDAAFEVHLLPGKHVFEFSVFISTLSGNTYKSNENTVIEKQLGPNSFYEATCKQDGSQYRIELNQVSVEDVCKSIKNQDRGYGVTYPKGTLLGNCH